MDREHKTRWETVPIKYLLNFATLTEIKIDKVIKQPTDSTIKSGDVLKVAEPASVVDYPESNLRQVIKSSGYEPIQKDNRYVLFMKKSSLGNYGVMNVNNGRFNLDKVGKQEDDFGKAFKKNVLAKFANELK